MTALADRTDATRGYIKGQPVRFVNGHNRRVDPPDPARMHTSEAAARSAVARRGRRADPDHRAAIASSLRRHYDQTDRSAEYSAVHTWLNRRYPRTGVCETCGATGQRTEYANLDGAYSHDRSDYRELCVACHRAFDLDRRGGRRSWRDAPRSPSVEAWLRDEDAEEAAR